MSSGVTAVRITPSQFERWKDRVHQSGWTSDVLIIGIERLEKNPTLANLERLIKAVSIVNEAMHSPQELRALLVEAYQTAREATKHR